MTESIPEKTNCVVVLLHDAHDENQLWSFHLPFSYSWTALQSTVSHSNYRKCYASTYRVTEPRFIYNQSQIIILWHNSFLQNKIRNIYIYIYIYIFFFYQKKEPVVCDSIIDLPIHKGLGHYVLMLMCLLIPSLSQR